MYSRILVAVDDSPISELALQEAIKLAQDQHAKLRIVYVADEFIPAGEGVPVDFKEHESEVKKKGRSILQKMARIARKTHDQVESHLIEVSEADNLVPEKILAEAKKWQADLIVLGTHGRSGISRLLLGSVAEEVVRNAHIPVQIIREQE